MFLQIYWCRCRQIAVWHIPKATLCLATLLSWRGLVNSPSIREEVCTCRYFNSSCCYQVPLACPSNVIKHHPTLLIIGNSSSPSFMIIYHHQSSTTMVNHQPPPWWTADHRNRSTEVWRRSWSWPFQFLPFGSRGAGWIHHIHQLSTTIFTIQKCVVATVHANWPLPMITCFGDAAVFRPMWSADIPKSKRKAVHIVKWCLASFHLSIQWHILCQQMEMWTYNDCRTFIVLGFWIC